MPKIIQLKPFFRDLKSASSKTITLIILSLGVLSTLGLVYIDRQISSDHEQVLATESLYRVRSMLEEALYKRMIMTVSMEAFVKAHPELDWHDPKDKQNIQDYFERFTSSLDRQVSGILSFQLAPDAIVTNLTNIEGSHHAIGDNLFQKKHDRINALNSIQQRGILVDEPITLFQGGEAIIAHQPIFTQPGVYNAQRYIDQNLAKSTDAWLQEIPSDFWGFATIIINPDILIQEAGLKDPSQRYRYSIRGHHHDGHDHGIDKEGEVFWGDESIFEKPLKTATISLPCGEWQIGIQSIAGVSWFRSLLIAAFGFGVTGILSYSFWVRQKTALELQHTNKQLIRATQLKDEFLANMSHELRTPLNAILGMTEGLQEEIFGPIQREQIEPLQTIERSGNHLLSLINDILDVAKIEAGKMELDFSATVLVPLVTSCLSFIKHQAQQKSIQLELIKPSALPDVILDKRRIRQALINLLNNAVKFTPEGGEITVEISFAQPPEKAYSAYLPTQSYLSISITDTGIGIAPEDVNKLFQPFIQIDSDLNRQYDGTGLGLTLVKRIVELHGGEVRLTSEVGVGSCFIIEIPCSIHISSLPDQPKHTQKIDSSPQPIEVESEIAPLILLAEDNEANIFTISSYLDIKGYRLLIAKNGKEAIALAESARPDLVLMDIQMPEMDGIEAIQHIRCDPTLVDTPIIALTALAMEGDRERCLTAGASDYLSKPVKLKQLTTSIQQLLDPPDAPP